MRRVAKGRRRHPGMVSLGFVSMVGVALSGFSQAQAALSNQTQTSSVTPPLNLQASNTTSNGTTLSWTVVPGAIGYKVYENGRSVATGVTSATDVVSGLDSRTTYAFTVSAVGADSESGQSQSVSVTTQTSTLKERAPVPPELTKSYADVLDAHWIQIYLRENQYNAANVSNVQYYKITNPNDPDFASGIHPIAVGERYFPEDGPYADAGTMPPTKLNEIYRISLELPATATLKQGMTYEVTVDPSVANVGTLPVEDLSTTPSESIHVNQVGYMTGGPKVAYLSFWTGQGSIDYSDATEFQLIDDSTGKTVYTGNIKLDQTGSNEKWGGSNVYSLDFSSFDAEGTYHLYVPGVGVSYPFKISSTIYSNQIGYTLTRALTMERDGNAGLDNPNVTHWTRPAAHMDDAIDQLTGQHVDLTGGWMDAGDRGKYPLDAAMSASAMLDTATLFPNQIKALGESLQIPESGNGIPDYLDELDYEVDWLSKVVMNTALNGAVSDYVHPANDGYEEGVPPQGETGRIYFDKTYGPAKQETLDTAATLAAAYNNPLMQEYFPEKMAGYKAAALKAFNAYVSHANDSSYWGKTQSNDNDGGPNPWSGELVYAAAELQQMTGDSSYTTYIKSDMPSQPLGAAQKEWGFENDAGPWLDAYLALYKDSYLSADLQQAAKNAILDWANTTLAQDQAPYGNPYPDQIVNQVGWYFSGAQIAFPMVMAYGLSGDVTYYNQIIKTWNYLLGGNPLNRSYISGLGDPQRSPRWLTNEISQYEWQQYVAGNGGWSEMLPGIPNADMQSGQFPSYFSDAYNAVRVNSEYPQLSSIPPIYRYTDTWNTTNEDTIDQLAKDASSVIPLVPTQLNTLTTHANHGTISPSGGSYIPGTKLTLSATPDLGYKFTGWSGSTTGTDNPMTVTMNTYQDITANFASTPTYTLSTSSTNGHIVLNPPGGVYNAGTAVTVTEVPDNGFQFSGWGGDLTGSTNTQVITMDGNKSITGNFSVAPTYTLQVNSSGGQVLQSPQKPEYTAGDEVTLQAIPEAGYVFKGWSGDLTSTQNPVKLVVDGNKTITANFQELPKYTLSLNATTGGSVTPASGGVPQGSNVTLAATPQPGYIFTGWSGDLTGVTNPVQITMDRDKTITATFQSKSGIISQDITTGLQGSTHENNGVYTITGYGDEVGTTPDSMRYVYQMGLTGRFSIAARLDSMTAQKQSGIAGMMIRTGTATNAAYAGMFVQNGQLVVKVRKGGDTSDTVMTQPTTLPVWMKITRGEGFPWIIKFYTSQDGVNWTQLKLPEEDFWAWMDASTPLTAGLFVNGGSPDSTPQSTTAQFSHVTWPVDKTPPTIHAVMPTNTSYLDDQTLPVAFTVNDSLSGVDDSATKATLDGTAVTSGASLNLYTLPLGPHSLTVTAADKAGNRTTQTVAFTTTTSTSSMQQLVEMFRQGGAIDNQGIATSLEQKLKNNDLQSFVHEVQAQSGKQIQSDKATYLIRDANWLLNK